MMEHTGQDAQDSVRDAAALLLAYVRQDVPMIEAISATNRIPNLLSGLLYVSGMIIVNGFREEAVPAMESLVQFLSTLPDSEWDSMVEKSRVIEGNL